MSDHDPLRERTIRTRRRLTLPLALGVLGLGLSACSGSGATARDSGTAAAGSTSTAGTPSGPSGSPTAPTAGASTRPTATPSARSTASSGPRATTTPAGPVDPLASSVPLETAPAPAGLPTCRAGDLSVSDADAVYTADSVQELFTVRTRGTDCQLQGYPEVQLLDAAGAALPATVGRGGAGLPAPSAQPLSLSRATSLSFFVSTARDGACSPASAATVTLPGSGGPVRAVTTMQVCAGAFAVGPVQRLGDEE